MIYNPAEQKANIARAMKEWNKYDKLTFYSPDVDDAEKTVMIRKRGRCLIRMESPEHTDEWEELTEATAKKMIRRYAVLTVKPVK